MNEREHLISSWWDRFERFVKESIITRTRKACVRAFDEDRNSFVELLERESDSLSGVNSCGGQEDTLFRSTSMRFTSCRLASFHARNTGWITAIVEYISHRNYVALNSSTSMVPRGKFRPGGTRLRDGYRLFRLSSAPRTAARLRWNRLRISRTTDDLCRFLYRGGNFQTRTYTFQAIASSHTSFFFLIIIFFIVIFLA